MSAPDEKVPLDSDNTEPEFGVRVEQSDAALWLEATSGTGTAFAELFDRHRARVFRKAYARVENVADAEDVVAIVFMEAWRNRKKVRIVNGSILPWLLTTTSYVTMNQQRSARRYRHLLSALPEPETTPDHADEVAGRVDGHVVTAALRSMSAADQRILDLCVVEELPLGTVAALLDIPMGTVKSRLSRAREKLRKKLDPTLIGASALTVNPDGATS